MKLPIVVEKMKPDIIIEPIENDASVVLFCLVVAAIYLVDLPCIFLMVV